eukprot:998517-Amphidinium_carterae.1
MPSHGLKPLALDPSHTVLTQEHTLYKALWRGRNISWISNKQRTPRTSFFSHSQDMVSKKGCFACDPPDMGSISGSAWTVEASTSNTPSPRARWRVAG